MARSQLSQEQRKRLKQQLEQLRQLMSKQGKGQPIREDGPQSHLAKRGTPTMGGLMILAGFTFSILLWANLSNS